MKASLQLKLGQQLSMTPQLQQAIRLLQLSTLDLRTEIQEAVEANPLLEMEDPQDFEQVSAPQPEYDNESMSSPGEDLPKNGANDSAIASDTALNQDTLPDEFPVDTHWEDQYISNVSSSTKADDSLDSVYQGETSQSLQDHLSWQLNLTPFSELDRQLAEALIDGIDERGYLTIDINDVLTTLRTDQNELELDEVEAVLHRIQQFDPPGVAARNLTECLLIQIRQNANDSHVQKQAIELLENYGELLESRDFKVLLRKMKIKEDTLKDIIAYLQEFSPFPGDTLQIDNTEYVIPDVSAKKENGSWTVELNNGSLPKITINNEYASLIKKSDASQDNQYLKNQLQEAKWFIKSIQSRNETLLKVAACIVQHQKDFLDYGEEAMRPLVLHDVADQVGMHESTISRVTTQKYMHTPRGIFELKYFFSSHVSTMNGGECSSTAIRALIKKLVAAEIPSKPLSDSKITDLLAEQGIKVARRTIAKYRESLAIPPSNERKHIVSRN